MKNIFTNLTTDIKNIGIPTGKQEVKDTSNYTVNIKEDKLTVIKHGPETKECEIKIDCNNMKKLVEIIKLKLDQLQKTYNYQIDDTIKKIKQEANTINTNDNLANFFKITGTLRENIRKAQNDKENEKNKDLKLSDIECKV